MTNAMNLPAGVSEADVERGALATINAEHKAFGSAPLADMSNVLPEAIEHHKNLARAVLTAVLAGRADLTWRPIATLDLSPRSDVILWNPCDGVHLLKTTYTADRLSKLKQSGTYTHWAIIAGPAASVEGGS